jgi:hypothetical protein
MAISRPFLLALLGAVLLGATFFAVQNARDSATDDAAPAAQQTQPAEQAAAPPAPAEPAPAEPATLTAEEALRAITDPGTRVTTGRFELNFDTREIGGGREHDTVQMSGAFECGCKADVPKFDVAVRTHADDGYRDAGQDVAYRMVSTGDEGFVGTEDTLYRVDPQPLENIAKLRSAVTNGPLGSAPDFDVSRWVTDAKVVGTEPLDGVEATHVRGELSARKVASDVVELLEADAARSQVDVPPGAVRIAERVVTRAQLDVWVGSDRVLRRLELRLRGDGVPRPIREANDSPSAKFSLSFELSEVNKPQQLDPPTEVSDLSPEKGMGAKSANGAQSGLSAGALLLNSPTGFAGTTVLMLRLAQSSEEGEGAQKAAKAVADGKKVAILFQNPDGLDDRAMRGVMRQLDARTRTVVLTDDVDAVDRYGSMVEDLGVSQTPAVVLIDRKGEARLIEGYVDTDTLAQAVADAR